MNILKPVNILSTNVLKSHQYTDNKLPVTTGSQMPPTTVCVTVSLCHVDLLRQNYLHPRETRDNNEIQKLTIDILLSVVYTESMTQQSDIMYRVHSIYSLTILMSEKRKKEERGKYIICDGGGGGCWCYLRWRWRLLIRRSVKKKNADEHEVD